MLNVQWKMDRIECIFWWLQKLVLEFRLEPDMLLWEKGLFEWNVCKTRDLVDLAHCFVPISAFSALLLWVLKTEALGFCFQQSKHTLTRSMAQNIFTTFHPLWTVVNLIIRCSLLILQMYSLTFVLRPTFDVNLWCPNDVLTFNSSASRNWSFHSYLLSNYTHIQIHPCWSFIPKLLSQFPDMFVKQKH